MYSTSVDDIVHADPEEVCDIITRYFTDDDGESEKINWESLVSSVVKNSETRSKCSRESSPGELFYRCITCEVFTLTFIYFT